MENLYACEVCNITFDSDEELEEQRSLEPGAEEPNQPAVQGMTRKRPLGLGQNGRPSSCTR